MGTILATLTTIAIITTTAVGTAVSDSKTPPPQGDPQVRLVHLRAAERLLSDRKLVVKWAAAQERAQRLERARERQRRTIPATGDWQTAVRVVQRIYPGTSSWLLSCSASEGGHGRWIPNRQGSGASGWLQFMRSTYYAWSPSAYRDVAARGFRVAPETNSWYHPLGQAITGAYMLLRGQRHQWAGSGC